MRQKKCILLIGVLCVSIAFYGCSKRPNRNDFEIVVESTDDMLAYANGEGATTQTPNQIPSKEQEMESEDDKESEKESDKESVNGRKTTDVLATREAYLGQMSSIIATGTIGNDSEGMKTEAEVKKLKKMKVPPVLFFMKEALPYDKATASYYLPLSMTETAWEQGQLSVEEGYSLLLVTSLPEDKLEAMQNTDGYIIYIYNETQYYEGHLVITGLPMISLNLQDGSSVDDVVEDDDTACSIVFYDSNTKTNWVYQDSGSIHLRGNLSLLFDKKSYKLEFDDKVSLCGMREDDDWILNAMYNDDSKVRDKFCSDIWNTYGANNIQDGVNYGTHLEYVELVINGEYWGLYGLMEPLDEKQFDIAKNAKIGEMQEYIFIRNGYYIGVNYNDLSIDDGLDEKCGFMIRNKKTPITVDDWAGLITYLDVVTLGDTDSLVKITDVENVTDYWLFLQLVTGVDNVNKNMVQVMKAMQDGSYKHYFVTWDYNYTFGVIYSEEESTNFNAKLHDARDVNWWNEGELYLSNDFSDAKSILKEKYKELSKTVLSKDYLDRMIDSYETQLNTSGAYTREASRWPNASMNPDLTQLKDYLHGTLLWLEEKITTVTQ